MHAIAWGYIDSESEECIPETLTDGSAPFDGSRHRPTPWKGRFAPACPALPDIEAASAPCTVVIGVLAKHLMY